MLDERPRLVVAAITILRAFIHCDEPQPQLCNFGSFEEWSDLIRSALVWLDMPDPVESQRQLRDAAEPERELRVEVLAAWYALFGSEPKSIQEALKTTEPSQAGPPKEETAKKAKRLKEALESATGGILNARTIGNVFGKWREGEVDALTQEELVPTEVRLDQLWIKFDVASRLYTTLGKQRVKWGAGRQVRGTKHLLNWFFSIPP